MRSAIGIVMMSGGLLGAALGTGCEPGPGREASLATMALCDARVVSAEARFLVSPRWSPQGDRLAASGHLGIGLHEIDLTTLEARAVAPDARPPVRYSADGRWIGYRIAGTPSARVEHDLSTGEVRAVSAPPLGAPMAGGEAPAEVLVADPAGSLVFEEHRGLLVRQAAGEETLVASDAWGVTPSPDGRRVAYCEGQLPAVTLHVVDASGERWDLGPGAHPSWLPSASPTLVYTRPSGREGVVLEADLHLRELAVDRSVRLTNTPGVIEMEPALSPAGDRIAWTDWASGRISVATLCAGGAR